MSKLKHSTKCIIWCFYFYQDGYTVCISFLRISVFLTIPGYFYIVEIEKSSALLELRFCNVWEFSKSCPEEPGVDAGCTRELLFLYIHVSLISTKKEPSFYKKALLFFIIYFQKMLCKPNRFRKHRPLKAGHTVRAWKAWMYRSLLLPHPSLPS